MSETNLLDLTVREIAAELPNLSTESLTALREAEAAGKTRKTVIEAIDAELAERDAALAAAIYPPSDPKSPPDPRALTLAEAEHRILRADYTGAECEIIVSSADGKLAFAGAGETRDSAYRSAVGAWLASEGKALA